MQHATKSVSRVAAAVDMLDLAPNRSERTIVRLAWKSDGITLSWDDGRTSEFHAMWLRDNCPCPECRHPQALERTFRFIDHPEPEIQAASMPAADCVEIRFAEPEGVHVARFAAGWLRHHCYSADARRERQPKARLWDASAIRNLPVVHFSDYMNTDSGLRAWLEALCSWGIVLLRGVPPEPGKLLDAAHRIGPVRTSNFGEYYDVVSMPNPNAVAYTSMALELHTDLANWRFPPDHQLLFCVKNDVVGGGSVLADGFQVAEDLRRQEPEAFRLLASHPLDFRFHDQSCDIAASAPTISLDGAGTIKRIRFNNWLRSTLSVPSEVVGPLYEALGLFWNRLRDPRYHLTVRLQPGDLFTYDNNRVLHGRESFDPNTGHRHLQGCYINHEDVLSKLALLDRSSLDPASLKETRAS